MHITIIIGTGREGRQSEKVARFAENVAKKIGHKTTLADIRDFATPFTTNDGPEAEKWIELVNKTDAFMLIVPEYNHNYPGELKILLDKANTEYAHKAIGVTTVSSGGFGGTRVMENILSLLSYFIFDLSKVRIHISNVKEIFTEKMTQENTDNSTKQFQKQIEDLEWINNRNK